MKKSKVYTRTGDKGDTGLVSGNRTSKADLRIDLYGELDELNSRVGFAFSHLSEKDQFKNLLSFLHDIQSAIFDLGSNLACEAGLRDQYKLPQISNSFVKTLESEIDKLDGNLPEIKNFILPGGTIAASAIHLCRTNARSVERKLIHYRDTSGEELPANALVFLNRLSDYFFVLARYLNFVEKVPEIEWKSRS